MWELVTGVHWDCRSRKHRTIQSHPASGPTVTFGRGKGSPRRVGQRKEAQGRYHE
jgi:hypothetical protein